MSLGGQARTKGAPMAPLPSRPRALRGSEFHVEAEANGIELRLDGSGSRRHNSRSLVKTIVQIFDARAQVLGQHVFDTAARDPAKMCVGETRAEGRGIIDVGPGRTTGAIEQGPVAIEGDAGAAAH